MKKTATLIAVCLAAACALALVTGCVNDISFVEVESVALNAPTLTLSPGGTGKLSATVMPEDAGDKTVAWSSSDKGVATVGNDGTVTAVAEGAATITARAGGKTAACAVTVCVHSYSGSNCTKCGFPNPSPADDDVPPKTDDNVQGGEEPSKTDGNVQEGGEPPKPDGEKTESTPTALLTIVNNSSYVLYDVKWNGTAVSYGGEISTEGTQSAPVFSGKACIYFSFYPKSGDGIKIGCHTDSDIGIASGGAASFTFTDDTIVVQPNFETNRNSLSTIHPYGLVIENGVVVKCDVDTVGTAIIPDGVTRIKSKAFYGCSALTSIIIPDSVTYIGDSAFSGCSGVKNVYYNGDVADWCRIEFDTYSSNPLYYNNENLYIKDKLVTEFIIPDSVTSIRNYAFYGCSSLTSVTIPDSVTSIGTSAFYGCSGLKNVYYNGDVADWCKIWFDTYSSNPLYHAGNLYIKDKLITELIIPDGVTSIGNSAFYGCSSLTSVTIPDSVTSIGSYAFYGCSGLTSVTIPNSVTTIGSSAFSECRGVTVTYTGTLAQWCRMSNGGLISNVKAVKLSDMENLKAATEIIIPSEVTSIGSYAFYGCSGLTSVTIPDGVTFIGSYAFYGCSGLTSVTIPDNVTSIGDSAFSGCDGLTSVTIPSGVTSIGYSAFRDCSNLTNVTIPDGVTYIGDYAFYGLTKMTMPASVISIVLRNKNLQTVVITSGDGIEVSAFKGCSGLKSVTILDGVTFIGMSAFSGCSGLTSVTIPGSVTSIGNSAFNNCYNLKTVYYGGSEDDWGNAKGFYSFYGCGEFEIIYNSSGEE